MSMYMIFIVVFEGGRKRLLKGCSLRQPGWNLPRQEVAFLEKAREIKGYGSLREEFYTGLYQENVKL